MSNVATLTAYLRSILLLPLIKGASAVCLLLTIGYAHSSFTATSISHACIYGIRAGIICILGILFTVLIPKVLKSKSQYGSQQLLILITTLWFSLSFMHGISEALSLVLLCILILISAAVTNGKFTAYLTFVICLALVGQEFATRAFFIEELQDILETSLSAKLVSICALLLCFTVLTIYIKNNVEQSFVHHQILKQLELEKFKDNAFLANFIHDLAQPLSTLLLSLDQLERKRETLQEERRFRLMNRCHVATERMHTLVREFQAEIINKP